MIPLRSGYENRSGAIDPRHGLAVKATRHPDYLYAGQIQELLVDHVKQVLGGRPSHGGVEFFVHARIGHPADQILALAREVGADLVFIGSHGLTGVERVLIGSVSERVVREAQCPVMVARQKAYGDVTLLDVVDDPSEHKPYKPAITCNTCCGARHATSTARCSASSALGEKSYATTT